VALVAVLAGCEPNPRPVKVMALIQTNQGTFAPKEVSLETVGNVTELSGTAANLIGGAVIVLNFSDPLIGAAGGNLTEQQIQQLFVRNPGAPVQASWVDKNGVLWPADFHTWNMVSLYYNFEQAFKYFLATGVVSQDITSPTAYYTPYFAIADGSGPEIQQKDNALFDAPIKAFAILPWDELQQVPLAMNPGVIAHEYSHWVLDQKAYGGRAFPQAILSWGGTPQINILKSVDEGLADFHAYGASCLSVAGCNTRWIEPSIDKQTADDRDIAPMRCIDRSLYQATGSFSNDLFLQQGLEYRLGTIIASTLYQTSRRVPDTLGAVEQAVVASYTDANGTSPGMEQILTGNLTNPQAVSLETLLNAILAHTRAKDVQTEMCNRFIDQLKANPGLMPDCPNTAVGGTDCPAL